MAPFNRYQTLDVVRAVVETGRADEVALYTGNDDNIIIDLLTQFQFGKTKPAKPVRIVGGLLGHWAVWTRRAVTQLLECQRIVVQQRIPIPPRMLTLAAQVTDANAAFFDPATRLRRLHRRHSRSPAPAGSARGHLVPGPQGNPFAGADGRDRPRLRGLPAPQRRSPLSPSTAISG